MRSLLAILLVALLLPASGLADRRGGGRQRAQARPASKAPARTDLRAVRPRAVKPRAARQKHRLRDLSLSVFTGTPAARRDRVAHGSWYTRKALRGLIYKARPSDHGRKHLKARTEAEAKSFSTKAAQYLPGIKNTQLERLALQKGTLIRRAGGDVWAIYRAETPVGYDGGKKTHWLRAELSSGTIHGHPMKLERVLKYLKDVK